MTLFAVIPVKGIGGGKSRLAGALDDAARARLNAALFGHALAAALATRDIANVLVVSPDDEALARAVAAGTLALRESGGGKTGGLNAALEDARALALAAGASALLVLPADLPWAGARDLAALAALAPRGRGVTLAPDARGEGTNVLLLRPADAVPFRFGPGSFRRHLAAARAARLPCRVVRHPRLAFDVDTPEDLARLG